MPWSARQYGKKSSGYRINKIEGHGKRVIESITNDANTKGKKPHAQVRRAAFKVVPPANRRCRGSTIKTQLPEANCDVKYASTIATVGGSSVPIK